MTSDEEKKKKVKKVKENLHDEKYCQVCDISFGRKSSKKQHDNIYHADYVVVYSCSFCDLTSLNVRNIITHHTRFHLEIPLPNERDIGRKEVPNTKTCRCLVIHF